MQQQGVVSIAGDYHVGKPLNNETFNSVSEGL